MKLKHLFFTVILITGFAISVWGQNAPIAPKAFHTACEKQTRSKDGSPGTNYWQNSADYHIKASVNVTESTLIGDEQIVYYNNSPDTIKTIVVRLYQDIFKKAVNRNTLFEVDSFDIHNGVAISQIQINNNEIDIDKTSRTGTLMFIEIPEKLLPKGQIEINISWQFHIPERTLIRMGTIDSTSLFLGQWYPQIAVYDDVYGWDKRSHNGLAEFYNDVNNFEVEITVPENFLVWATGEPVNISEVLQPDYFNKYQEASISDEMIHIITKEDLEHGTITTDIHTWKFKADKVTDFAFGISDHYLWDATSVVVDSTTNRRTVVAAAYKEDAPHFDKVADIAKRTVSYLSSEMPGIPFPFPYMTVFNGDFGMEYPMITNVGADDGYAMTVYAHTHEITHSYFPFYVCTNETKNGWIDEGFTVFLPEKLQTELAPELNEGTRNAAVLGNYSGLEDEPAVITPTYYLDSRIYFYLNYAKTDVALNMLQLELGEDVFKECLRSFIDNWKRKHPTPYDFFNTFNHLSEQNLDWFWNAWYYQQGGIPDLTIENVNIKRHHYDITVFNTGDLPLPIVLSYYSGDQLINTITKPAKLWNEYPKGITIEFDTPEEITKITIGNNYIPDAHQEDNIYLTEE